MEADQLAGLVGLGDTGDAALLAEALLVDEGRDALAHGESSPGVLLRGGLGTASFQGGRTPPLQLLDFGFPAHGAGW